MIVYLRLMPRFYSGLIAAAGIDLLGQLGSGNGYCSPPPCRRSGITRLTSVSTVLNIYIYDDVCLCILGDCCSSIANISIPTDDYVKLHKSVERVGWAALPVETKQESIATPCTDTTNPCGPHVFSYDWVYKSTLEVGNNTINCDGLEGMFGDSFCKTKETKETVTGLEHLLEKINEIAATATTAANVFCFPSASSATCTDGTHHPITADLNPGATSGAGYSAEVRATYFALCNSGTPNSCPFVSGTTGAGARYTTANAWLMAVMWGAAKMKALGWPVAPAPNLPYICNYTGGTFDATAGHYRCSREDFLPYYAEGDTTDRGYVGNLSTDVTTDLFELINGTKPGATKFSERTVHPQLRSLNDTATVLRYETNCKFFAYNMQIFTSVICADSLPTVAMLGLTYLFFFIFGWFSIVIFWIVHHYLKNYYYPPAPDFAKGQELYRSDTFMAPDSAMPEERTDNKSRVSIAM
eukprot:GHVU01201333.1.p1 GENE.GHVU01201333.1~~GHVU01201333.1.p1  ORF type:complete len:469 (-),score=26.68 GHVU01201333.1:22-1428(-)